MYYFAVYLFIYLRFREKMCLCNCDIRSISGTFLGGIHFHIPGCIVYVM